MSGELKHYDGTTHYAGCIQAGPKHYECALQEIGRLRLTITHLRAVLEKAQFSYERGFDDGFILRKEKDKGKHYTAKDKYSAAPEERYNESGQLIELHPKWVGLTDEDKEECLAKWAELGWWGVVDVIEAKLREKNGG